MSELNHKGINAALESYSGQQLTNAMSDLGSLGVGWERLEFQWQGFQPNGPNDWNVGNHDAAVQALTAAGINTLGLIDYGVSWANGGNDQMTPPDPAQFAAYCGKLAAYYSKMGVHTWEIWNEPNNLAFWSTGANAAQYTQMLKLAYTAIHQADPNATVLVGGMSPAADGGGYMSPQSFLQGTYDNGGKGYFDGVADHPYIPGLPTATDGSAAWWNAQADLHNIMVQNGDTTRADGSPKLIWDTEYGSPTNGPSGFISQDEQATKVTQSYQLEEQEPWAGPLFWYSYKDNGTDPSTVENFFNLENADGSHKPAFAAYQAVPTGQSTPSPAPNPTQSPPPPATFPGAQLTAEQQGAVSALTVQSATVGHLLSAFLHAADAGQDIQAVGNTLATHGDTAASINAAISNLVAFLQEYVGSGLSHFGGMTPGFALDVVKLGVVALQAGSPQVDRAFGGTVVTLFQQEASALVAVHAH
ncbi:MAG: cellulase family glycosylhydrolase [Acetobacteraceae bacterium]|nr:cellulase family glycosylhydrolase [Acetobacteraceae bacterium]MBV8616056.1 cellulase family glycosylhydrolase [Acetobacteraceae bacterium]